MFIDRLNALLWTCAIELPVYAWWMQGRFSRSSLLIAIVIGLQITTQPLLWEYTSRSAGGKPALLLAEGVAWIAEALLLYVLTRRFAAGPLTMRAAVVMAGRANLLSLLAGLALNAVLYG